MAKYYVSMTIHGKSVVRCSQPSESSVVGLSTLGEFWSDEAAHRMISGLLQIGDVCPIPHSCKLGFRTATYMAFKKNHRYCGKTVEHRVNNIA